MHLYRHTRHRVKVNSFEKIAHLHPALPNVDLNRVARRGGGGRSMPCGALMYSCLLLLAICTTVRGKWAYATLLLDEAFIAGVRVLGSSLADTGSPHDRLVLCSSSISRDTLALLSSEGWIAKPIELVRTGIAIFTRLWLLLPLQIANPHFDLRPHLPVC